MSYYFDRVCKIEVSGNSDISIENAKIRFEITKSSLAQENTGKIEIYNLSPTTRANITDQDIFIRVLAGYTSNQGLIEVGQGDISSVRTNRTRTDVITQIFISEGYQGLKKHPVSLEFKNSIKLSDAINELTKQSNFTFKYVGLYSHNVRSYSYSNIGSLDTVLNDLAFKFDFNWSVQNGVIVLSGKANEDVSKEVLILTPKTGLILNPEFIKKPERSLSNIDTRQEIPELHVVQCLMQPQLQIHDTIQIESAELSGNFNIKKIQHIGDVRANDWYSNLEVLRI